jgi:hypothetical protein
MQSYASKNSAYSSIVINTSLLVGSGSANLIEISPTQPTLTIGMSFNIKLGYTNSSATVSIKHVPLNLTYSLKRPSLSGLVDIPIGSLVAGNIIIVIFDGTYFQAISGLPSIWE